MSYQKDKKKPTDRRPAIWVHELNAIYALAEAELLHCVINVKPSWHYKDSYDWLVLDTPEVQAVVKKYLDKKYGERD